MSDHINYIDDEVYTMSKRSSLSGQLLLNQTCSLGSMVAWDMS